MKRFRLSPALVALALLGAAFPAGSAAAVRRSVNGWLNWRGPTYDGVSQEKGLPDSVSAEGQNLVWKLPLRSRGTVAIAEERAYIFGYEGEGPEMQEVLLCVNPGTGAKLWERRFNDFLSDIIYDRYSIGSPTVDPETGNVFVLTSAGIFASFTPEGQPVWQHSLMEEIGRMTFPNGRTGSPLIDGDLVIIRAITSNWGADGPAADRFYAWDKQSGRLVWSSLPGTTPPKDNSFALPIPGWEDGHRVLYSGTGCGNLVSLDVRTGQPRWRYQMAVNGVNVTVVPYKDSVICGHDQENVDSSENGRMVALRTGWKPAEGMPGPRVLDRTAEVWRNDVGVGSSTPVLVGDTLYAVTTTGFLCSVNAATGAVAWRHRLGPDQLHASPLFADGKLYIPLHNGTFFILRPTATGVEQLCAAKLPGACLGAPSVWNGRVYVTTTEGVYCFGSKAGGGAVAAPALPGARPAPGKTVALQVIPAEVVLQPGEKVEFTVRGIDEHGFPTKTYPPASVTWQKFIPPTARVRSEMDAVFDASGALVARPDAKASAGAFRATADGVSGTMRGRLIPRLPYREDFQAFEMPEKDMAGAAFGYPPLSWIGARFKWNVVEKDGGRVLGKTLDNILFQRSTVFFGVPSMRNYTVEADVMSDGNRRIHSTIGLINQRYAIILNGNAQTIEVSSNQEHLKVEKPFAWKPGAWYRLKTRVDAMPDGSAVVRARAWPRGEAEPQEWTIEVPHSRANLEGSPGLFGFTPQSKFSVYFDNVAVTPNG